MMNQNLLVSLTLTGFIPEFLEEKLGIFCKKKIKIIIEKTINNVRENTKKKKKKLLRDKTFYRNIHILVSPNN